ncbi:hypothetical protein DPMN_074279 [Dreissena polymorpha]|uniref:Uncharacterized protein n=1 Tax=Dreissena polymorpha TaxID=45954 RepID=A0A9D3YIB4_DREPO|nr:hypothetical protein DPMN_074279 [Dreissena polymorpha]
MMSYFLYMFQPWVQSGYYQAVTQVSVAYGTYHAQYHAMAQGALPVQYQLMTQVPVSLAGQLQCLLVGAQGQLIDSGIQAHLTYMLPPVQADYVT